MAEVLNPKKDEKKDQGIEYECGACHATWTSKTKSKRCPECGTEF